MVETKGNIMTDTKLIIALCLMAFGLGFIAMAQLPAQLDVWEAERAAQRLQMEIAR